MVIFGQWLVLCFVQNFSVRYSIPIRHVKSGIVTTPSLFVPACDIWACYSSLPKGHKKSVLIKTIKTFVAFTHFNIDNSNHHDNDKT